ncbi:hypothetical protein B0G69_7018 [Paraburkholderia sp. RAU2J]|nr:hypothetical protein B0G69_7018 [Paraburkholderia sp. RAU2J]
MRPWSCAWQIRLNPCSEKPPKRRALRARRFAGREQAFEHARAPILMLCKCNDKLRAACRNRGTGNKECGSRPFARPAVIRESPGRGTFGSPLWPSSAGAGIRGYDQQIRRWATTRASRWQIAKCDLVDASTMVRRSRRKWFKGHSPRCPGGLTSWPSIQRRVPHDERASYSPGENKTPNRPDRETP